MNRTERTLSARAAIVRANSFVRLGCCIDERVQPLTTGTAMGEPKFFGTWSYAYRYLADAIPMPRLGGGRAADTPRHRAARLRVLPGVPRVRPRRPLWAVRRIRCLDPPGSDGSRGATDEL